MPKQQILPTWLALNNANFASPTGLTDLRTGQPFEAGGLGLGDYFDVTEKEANGLSFTANGLLHSGRYRLVMVDSGATAANVKTGTVGFIRIGMVAQGVLVTAAGTAGSPGSYMVPAPAGLGGGSGAVVQVVVGTSGAVTSASVVQGGANYSGPLTALSFSLTGLVPGLTGATLLLQLNSTPNVVTSADQASAQFSLLPARAVVFLNPITPGNYGFVQELGVATVLTGAGLTAPTVVNANTSGVVASGTLGIGSIGEAIETATATGQLIKIYMQYLPICQD
jgi:hypothetical protein